MLKSSEGLKKQFILVINLEVVLEEALKEVSKGQFKATVWPEPI